MGRIQNYSMLNCAVNPQACKEGPNAYRPIFRSRKVMVIGGGVAGCEAARVLAIRGHKPVMFEKTGVLGGNLIPGGAPSFKEDDIALAKWYARQMELLGVEVHMNTEVTKEMVLSGGYDTVIVATGSTPKVFSLGDDEKVYTAADVLIGAKDPVKQRLLSAAVWSDWNWRLIWRKKARRLRLLRQWTSCLLSMARSAQLIRKCCWKWFPLKA